MKYCAAKEKKAKSEKFACANIKHEMGKYKAYHLHTARTDFQVFDVFGTQSLDKYNERKSWTEKSIAENVVQCPPIHSMLVYARLSPVGYAVNISFSLRFFGSVWIWRRN